MTMAQVFLDLSQDSVHKAIASNPDQFVVAAHPATTSGTEEMLDAVSAHFGLPPKTV